jgi:hypothetical protein
VLARYDRAHRRDASVMYHGTNAVARLYASNGAPQRLARQLILRGAQLLPPLKAAIVARLVREGLKLPRVRPAAGRSASSPRPAPPCPVGRRR